MKNDTEPGYLEDGTFFAYDEASLRNTYQHIGAEEPSSVVSQAQPSQLQSSIPSHLDEISEESYIRSKYQSIETATPQIKREVRQAPSSEITHDVPYPPSPEIKSDDRHVPSHNLSAQDLTVLARQVVDLLKLNRAEAEQLNPTGVLNHEQIVELCEEALGRGEIITGEAGILFVIEAAVPTWDTLFEKFPALRNDAQLFALAFPAGESESAVSEGEPSTLTLAEFEVAYEYIFSEVAFPGGSANLYEQYKAQWEKNPGIGVEQFIEQELSRYAYFAAQLKNKLVNGEVKLTSKDGIKNLYTKFQLAQNETPAISPVEFLDEQKIILDFTKRYRRLYKHMAFSGAADKLYREYKEKKLARSAENEEVKTFTPEVFLKAHQEKYERAIEKKQAARKGAPGYSQKEEEFLLKASAVMKKAFTPPLENSVARFYAIEFKAEREKGNHINVEDFILLKKMYSQFLVEAKKRNIRKKADVDDQFIIFLSQKSNSPKMTPASFFSNQGSEISNVERHNQKLKIEVQKKTKMVVLSETFGTYADMMTYLCLKADYKKFEEIVSRFFEENNEDEDVSVEKLREFIKLNLH